MDRRPIRRLRPDPGATPIADGLWPATVPAVAHVLRKGIELQAGVTVLVGENGSGKSTLVEVIAAAVGLNAEGGSGGAQHRTRASEPGSLGLIVERGPGAPRWAYLLRDETLHGLYSYLEENRSWHRVEPRFHELSHGEAFLSIFHDRATQPGLYLLDEPDAALSFTATLSLLAALKDLAADGAQVVIATHSPVLAALPGAHLLEVGPWGIRAAAWDELELTANWRQFLRAPESFLRHLG
ncbi:MULTISPECIES: AAA family ATPase [unclassified Modestobacter]|uniref:AAA family ATPase n=1 Tax=unclassified Modestobacter TaxID=2643866 RepID=UPI0022AADC1C|nr:MULTISPECIES: AAA family ATPase [unclassified Modestobacter]MCZ2826265.1 AAA family ATPase [Modestobacter sp. VKM Ac-2981]MCZ2852670.1 AAA family ATPase [Modestobacter sp. VKM Ac-2982]